MKDPSIENQEIVEEISALKQRIQELEQSEAEHKRTKNTLLEHQERLQEICKSAHIGIWDWNAETKTITWTEELFSIAGLDPTLPAPAYSELSTIFTPESWKALKTAVENAMKTGETYQLELELIRPNGDIRCLKAFGGIKSDPDGRINGLYGIVQDITEYRQIEDNLKLDAEIFNNMAEGVCLIMASDGRIVYVNSWFDKMFKYAPGELIGKPVGVLNAPTDKDPEEIARDIQGVLNSTGAWSGDILNIKKDGTVFWCYENVSSFNHTQYKNVWVAVHKDITERKKVEEELARYRMNLEGEIRERTVELEIKGISLQEANTALKVLLEQREVDKREMEDRFLMNLRTLVLPYIEHMKNGHLEPRLLAYIEIIEKHLNEILSPLLKNMQQFNLTLQETRVASLLMQDKSTKEIAELLGLASPRINRRI